MNRRKFIQTCGLGAFGALIPAGALTWRELSIAAENRPLASNAGIVVLITLNGGNDGLNTLVPYQNNAYYDGRPELAIAPEDVLPLDEDLGLNPALEGFSRLFADGSLAIIRGVGYPEPDRSHFRSMDIWQSGSIDNAVTTGWVGRWLDATKSDPLRALAVGNTVPTLAIGETTAAATISGNTVPVGDLKDLISGFSAEDGADAGVLASIRASYRASSALGDHFQAALSDDGSNKIDLGEGGLAGRLMAVAKCINADVPTQVYSVVLSGFDTHASERGTHQRLLQTLDQSVSQFMIDISGARRGGDVVVVVYSEFGRRVRANASDGTDHGTAAPVFVIGKQVRGGFYGDEPNLGDLADGDLKSTSDFRDIYHELLAGTLATEPESVIGPGRTPHGFLRT